MLKIKMSMVRILFLIISLTPSLSRAKEPMASGESKYKSDTITVAQDGSGDYRSVQAALDQVPVGNKEPVVIYIRNGFYKERLILNKGQDFVHMIGESKDSTILTYDNHSGKILDNGDTINTYTSASFFIYANDFKAENITFQNNAGFTAGQAVAVFAYGDKLHFSNCRIVGFQDVLFCSGPGNRQYYDHCYIEGTTDFIFGPAVAVFQNCHIHSKKNSHVTAASTAKELPFGFVFFDCHLTADPEVNKVSLGRPWRPYASVTYIRCELGDHIIPQGWHNWNDPEKEKTARYSEYKNYGPGAKPGERVSWAHQLSDQEASKFTIENILGDWNPLKEL